MLFQPTKIGNVCYKDPKIGGSSNSHVKKAEQIITRLSIELALTLRLLVRACPIGTRICWSSDSQINAHHKNLLQKAQITWPTLEIGLVQKPKPSKVVVLVIKWHILCAKKTNCFDTKSASVCHGTLCHNVITINSLNSDPQSVPEI